ncbi:thiol-disulfide isomerase [Microbacterium sp. CH12i]|uniref:thioredoxin family protein n=1 Tax=Microbacterium sp. CH12i TaxID=1479651 RepID=UPI000460FEE4|nr:thioredoxin family protein [Microbacterium sp. CH12i]KDA05810.1 thiol-disulfide isomerase [Microbacterium sp. CH12i]
MPVSTALLIAGALVVLAVIGGFGMRMLDGRLRSGGDLRVRADDLSGAVLAPGATLVQFSTELCARCPQVRRLLSEIAESRGGVEHVEIDLTNRNDLASRYHVLQTPTTFLVDASGAVLSRWGGVPDRRAINEALASLKPLATLQNQEQR